MPDFSAEQRELLARREFAICVGTFYDELAKRLTDGATREFTDAGVDSGSIHVHEVPGAFELPLAAKWCAESGRFAGIACLGTVIRGQTDHYDHVCRETARGIAEVGLATGVPCAFGVITCDTMEQVLARSGGDKRDQGRDSARAVMRMFLVHESIARG